MSSVCLGMLMTIFRTHKATLVASAINSGAVLLAYLFFENFAVLNMLAMPADLFFQTRLNVLGQQSWLALFLFAGTFFVQVAWGIAVKKQEGDGSITPVVLLQPLRIVYFGLLSFVPLRLFSLLLSAKMMFLMILSSYSLALIRHFILHKNSRDFSTAACCLTPKAVLRLVFFIFLIFHLPIWARVSLPYYHNARGICMEPFSDQNAYLGIMESITSDFDIDFSNNIFPVGVSHSRCISGRTMHGGGVWQRVLTSSLWRRGVIVPVLCVWKMDPLGRTATVCLFGASDSYRPGNGQYSPHHIGSRCPCCTGSIVRNCYIIDDANCILFAINISRNDNVLYYCAATVSHGE